MGQSVAGDVIVVPFPQTDLTVGKPRPALVLFTVEQSVVLRTSGHVHDVKLQAVLNAVRKLFT